MIDALARFFGLGSSAERMLVGDVLVILAVATLVVLAISAVLAGGAVAFRSGKVSRERRRSTRSLRWQQALHHVLYGGADPETLWREVESGSEVDYLNFLIDYVRRLGGDEHEKIRVLAEPYLPRIMPHLDHPEDGRRMRAVQTLGELGLPRYGAEVIEALDDPAPMVAMVAASTLARDKTPEYADAVLARLHRFEHWRQDFLAAMLASMGAGAAPPLRATLADPKRSERVRAVAADALATLSDHRAADVAEPVLRSDGGVELRAACLRLLAQVGRARHLDTVRASVASGELPIRLCAVRALGHFGVVEDMTLLERVAKEDESPWVALAAARALKDGGAKERLERLAGSEHPRAALGLQVISETALW